MTTAVMSAVSRHQTGRWRVAHYDHPRIPSRINRASLGRRSAPTATHLIGASPIRPAHRAGEIPSRVVDASASIQTLDQLHVLRGADHGHAGTGTPQELDRRRADRSGSVNGYLANPSCMIIHYARRFNALLCRRVCVRCSGGFVARRRWHGGQLASASGRQPAVASFGDGFPDQLGNIDDEIRSGLTWIAGSADLAGTDADDVVQPTAGLAVDQVKHRTDDLAASRRGVRWLMSELARARCSCGSPSLPTAPCGASSSSPAFIACWPSTRPSPRR